MVLSSDSVRGEQVNDLIGSEASVGHTSQNLVDRVGRLWDREIWSGARNVGATSHELQARATRAVRHADGAGELDAVGRLGGGEATSEWDVNARCAERTYKSPKETPWARAKGR